MMDETSAPAEQAPIARMNALQRERLELRAERYRRQQRTRLDRYRPYPKQFAFHAAGAANRERLFMAGNRCGKTLSGAAEMAMHLSGQYPAWWEGKRFEKADTSVGGGYHQGVNA